MQGKEIMMMISHVLALCSFTTAVNVLGINPLSGRDKVDMNIGIRNDFLLTNCRDSDLKRSFPDLEYALMGYHILKGFPLAIGNDPGFTKPIFQANYTGRKMSADCKYSVPEGYTIVPDVSCQTTMSSKSITNRQQFKSAMGASAKAPKEFKCLAAVWMNFFF